MKKQIMLLALGLVLSVSASAQLKIDANGKAHIGPYYSAQSSVPTLSLLGPNGAYRAGAKLAFGDFGYENERQWNVFLGEYSDEDTDKLWLHGDAGFIITVNERENPNGTQPIYTFIDGNRSTMTVNVNATLKVRNNVVLTSDGRFKSNIVKLETPLNKILKLDGVSYDFNDAQRTEMIKEKIAQENALSFGTKTELSAEEKVLQEAKSIKEKATLPAISLEKKGQVGFIAQDLQKVFPNLVETDEMGYLGINYIGLIPVLVEAMKEEQQIIDAQSQKIKELETLVSAPITIDPVFPIDPIRTKSTQLQTSENTSDLTNAFLYQNTPNPFSENTEIKYFIPEGVNTSILYIFDLQGAIKKQIPLQEKGRTASIMINRNDLNAGMYIYSLSCDNQIVDTKKMILTK